MNGKSLANWTLPVSKGFIFQPHRDAMIDWTRISDLESDLGADELSGLISMFLDEVGTAVAALRDPTEADMHFLRGSASTLGFAELARLAGQGEDNLKLDRAAQIDCATIKSVYVSEKEELLTKFPQVQ